MIAPRVIAVAGGARGTGRSTIAQNLAAAVARRALRVCLLDAAGGAAPGVGEPCGRATLVDVATGQARLSDALAPGADGVDGLAFTTGRRAVALGVAESALLAAVDALETRYDLVLVDAPLGPQPQAAFFAAAASDVLLVVTPEAAALRQAEALVRLLAARCGRRELLLVANACAGAADAATVGRTLGALASRPPHVRLESLGWIPFDDAVAHARRARRTLAAAAPEARATRAIDAVADRLVSLAPPRPTGAAQFFFQSLIAQGRAA
jgi:flagellar biosynthesis protein FlhG